MIITSAHLFKTGHLLRELGVATRSPISRFPPTIMCTADLFLTPKQQVTDNVKPAARRPNDKILQILKHAT